MSKIEELRECKHDWTTNGGFDPALSKCKSADKYKGQYPPRCNGGKGCDYCWGKYIARQQ